MRRRDCAHWIDWLLVWGLILWVLIGLSVFLSAPAEGRNKRLGKDDLDLPVGPVKLGDQLPQEAEPPPPAQAPPPDPVGDDPRDTPPPVFYGEEIDLESDEIVYVIDRSGSMRTGSGEQTRMAKAKRELCRSIDGLSDNLSFNAWSFSSTVTSMWGETREATPANKATAKTWVNAQGASGGTQTGPAMATALQAHTSCLNFVLLTDGAPTGNAGKHRKWIRQNNHQKAVIDVFGIETMGVTRSFCMGVASDSGGSYYDVP